MDGSTEKRDKRIESIKHIWFDQMNHLKYDSFMYEYRENMWMVGLRLIICGVIRSFVRSETSRRELYSKGQTHGLMFFLCICSHLISLLCIRPGFFRDCSLYRSFLKALTIWPSPLWPLTWISPHLQQRRTQMYKNISNVNLFVLIWRVEEQKYTILFEVMSLNVSLISTVSFCE